MALYRFPLSSYFSKNGLEYNMLRVPIGGTDFSTHTYAYNELPENDTHLTNYTLAPEDTMYKVHNELLVKYSQSLLHVFLIK